MNWTSVYIFFNHDKFKALQQAVIPLVEELKAEGQIASYFYIFYKERGFHIRLRLKSELPDEHLYEVCRVRFGEYFEVHPSVAGEEREPDFYPNDTVHLIPYEPEVQRYGGYRGLEVSERHFRYSSDFVFSYVKADKIQTKNNLFNIALRFHLVTAWVYGRRNIEEAAHFLQLIFFRSFGVNSPFIVFNHSSEAPYNENFRLQREVLIPYVRAIWDSFGTNSVIDEQTENWKATEAEIYDSLNDLLQKNELELPFLYEQYPLWSIAMSYVHMTNNRLGIQPFEEPLIAYLLMRSLKEI